MAAATAVLTPKQQEISTHLLAVGGQRPVFAPELSTSLRARLEGALGDVAATVADGDRLVISKHSLAQVFACEGLFQSSLGVPFAWSIPTVRGRVAHRAIERMILSGGVQPPLDYVDQAIERLAEDDYSWGPGEFLRNLTAEDRLDLLRDVGDLATKFSMDWPLIPRSWTPRIESHVRMPLCDGRIELSGRYDIALGKPTGPQAGVFIADLKTGRQYPAHIEDVRFYALLETLTRGVPPYRIASYYLDSGTFRPEDVTPATLDSTTRRVIEGTRKIVRLNRSGDAELRGNPLCPFCPALPDCDEGARWERRKADDEPV